MYGVSIGDKSGDLGWTWAYFSGEQNFPQKITRTRLSERNEIWPHYRVWPIETYFPNFVNFDSGSRDTMRWHASVFHWCTCKVFFDNFSMFADNFRLVACYSLRCPRIKSKLLVQLSSIVRYFPYDSTVYGRQSRYFTIGVKTRLTCGHKINRCD